MVRNSESPGPVITSDDGTTTSTLHIKHAGFCAHSKPFMGRRKTRVKMT